MEEITRQVAMELSCESIEPPLSLSRVKEKFAVPRFCQEETQTLAHFRACFQRSGVDCIIFVRA